MDLALRSSYTGYLPVGQATAVDLHSPVTQPSLAFKTSVKGDLTLGTCAAAFNRKRSGHARAATRPNLLPVLQRGSQASAPSSGAALR